jgi:hypothetical protein
VLENEPKPAGAARAVAIEGMIAALRAEVDAQCAADAPDLQRLTDLTRRLCRERLGVELDPGWAA